MRSKAIEPGTEFGLNVVMHQCSNANGAATWLCRCKLCGRKKVVRGTNLRSGHQMSCYCQNSSTKGARDKQGKKPFSRIVKQTRAQWYPHASLRDVRRLLTTKRIARMMTRTLGYKIPVKELRD